ncbi:hypothetical protein CU665_22540 [Pseudomonas syringae pv. actinidifoliorum]|nr:hypothetical protein [Pseudomonas syringae pv. actinidifoliorum]NAT39293.1 hypothetical protein [Pseudomonas syringae pv. actinidifoliorum]
MKTIIFNRDLFKSSIGKVRTKRLALKAAEIRNRQNFPIIFRAHHLYFQTAIIECFHISNYVSADTTDTHL